MNFYLFFFFNQSTALSSRAVDDHQMSFGGSVVGKASTIEISPTPPLIFTRGVKNVKVGVFKTSLNIEQTAFKNAARYPNSETNFLCRNDRSIRSMTMKVC